MLLSSLFKILFFLDPLILPYRLSSKLFFSSFLILLSLDFYKDSEFYAAISFWRKLTILLTFSWKAFLLFLFFYSCSFSVLWSWILVSNYSLSIRLLLSWSILYFALLYLSFYLSFKILLYFILCYFRASLFSDCARLFSMSIILCYYLSRPSIYLNFY